MPEEDELLELDSRPTALELTELDLSTVLELLEADGAVWGPAAGLVEGQLEAAKGPVKVVVVKAQDSKSTCSVMDVVSEGVTVGGSWKPVVLP